MLEKDMKAPPVCDINEGSLINNNASILFNDIPSTIPGCFAEYVKNYSESFLTNCDYCEVRLECARQTAGGE